MTVDLGTLLGVWAHPDDETYLSAGLMAAAAAAGRRVVCVTATRGELGSWDEERWPTATLGKVRETELLRSLAVLGEIEHHWLGYPDGGCAGVDEDEAVERVARIVDAVRPDTIVTFGPDGMTGHDDHKAVGRWAAAALDRTSATGRLLYATQSRGWRDRFYDRMQEFNVFMVPGTPPVTPDDEMAVRYRLPPDVLELKLRAIAEHTSQVEGMLATFGADFFRESMAEEYFRNP